MLVKITVDLLPKITFSYYCSSMTLLVLFLSPNQSVVKVWGTRGNAVPAPPVLSPKRSPTSDFQRTQENAEENAKVR